MTHPSTYFEAKFKVCQSFKVLPLNQNNRLLIRSLHVEVFVEYYILTNQFHKAT